MADAGGEGGGPPGGPEAGAPPKAAEAEAGSEAGGGATVLREDQVRSAVGFLTHPKVRGSPDAQKQAFLRQKGLTDPEVTEAFRRARQVPSSSAPAGGPSPRGPQFRLCYTLYPALQAP